MIQPIVDLIKCLIPFCTLTFNYKYKCSKNILIFFNIPVLVIYVSENPFPTTGNLC